MSRNTEITSYIKGGEELNLSELRNLYYQAVLKSRYQETNWWSHRIIEKSGSVSKLSMNEYNRIPFHCYSNIIMLLYVTRRKGASTTLPSDCFKLQAYDMATGNEITEVTLTQSSDLGSTSKIVGRENGGNIYLNYAYCVLRFDDNGTYTDADGILTSKMCMLQIKDKFNDSGYNIESKINQQGYFRLIEIFSGLDNGYSTITENEVISDSFLLSLQQLQNNQFGGPTPGASVNRISNYLFPIIANFQTNENKYDIFYQYNTVGQSFVDGYYNRNLNGTNFSTQKIAFMNSTDKDDYTFTTLSNYHYDFSEANFDLYAIAKNNYDNNFKLQRHSDTKATIFSDTPASYKWKEFNIMGAGTQDLPDAYAEKLTALFAGSEYFSFLNFGATQFLEGFDNTYQLNNFSQFWKFYNDKIGTGETPIDNISLSLLLNTFKTAFWKRNIDVVEVEAVVNEFKSEISSVIFTYTIANYTANIRTEADLGFFCDLIYTDDGSTYDIDIPLLNIYINFKPIF